MALHPEFPRSPYSELLPDQRWFPAAEELRSTSYEKLLPPLVANIRIENRPYLAVGFKLDYVKADDDLSNYIPDFPVKTTDGTIWIVETKGREELDLPQKMARLRQWCEDASDASVAESGSAYKFVYVDQPGYERNPPRTFAGLAAAFGEYQGG